MDGRTKLSLNLKAFDMFAKLLIILHNIFLETFDIIVVIYQLILFLIC